MRHQSRSSRRHALAARLEPLESRSLLSVTVGSSFPGLAFGADGSDYEPPDTNLAVGPNNVVEIINTALAVYDKSGKLLQDAPLSAIFTDDKALNFSDPQITYDSQANNGQGQFFIGSLAYSNDGTVSHFDYALLDSASPSTTPVANSTHYQDATEGKGLTGDFPRLGWNADAYFVTMNEFDNSTGNFSHVLELTIDKSKITDTTANPVVNSIDTSGGDFTIVPATMRDPSTSSSGTELFVEENGFQNGSQLRVIKMVNDLSSTPTVGSAIINVPRYSSPPSAAQPGGYIATNDSRILDAVYAGGHLVATQTVGGTLAANARVYDLTINAEAGGINVKLNQTIQINPGRRISTYFPSVDINPTNGDLGITYLQSSHSQYMSMYVTGRTPTDNAGTVETPVEVAAGQATYQGSRAGDFSAVSLDPSTGEFWAGNEYAQSPSNTYWGTWIAEFSVGTGSSPATSTASTAIMAQDLTDPIVMLLAAADSSKKK